MRMIHRITFQQDSTADGTIDPSYTDVLTAVPCNIDAVQGGEVYRGKQLQANTTNVIETRYYDGLLPNMIAVNDISGVTYTITKILPVAGRSKYMLIEAVQVVV